MRIVTRRAGRRPAGSSSSGGGGRTVVGPAQPPCGPAGPDGPAAGVAAPATCGARLPSPDRVGGPGSPLQDGWPGRARGSQSRRPGLPGRPRLAVAGLVTTALLAATVLTATGVPAGASRSPGSPPPTGAVAGAGAVTPDAAPAGAPRRLPGAPSGAWAGTPRAARTPVDAAVAPTAAAVRRAGALVPVYASDQVAGTAVLAATPDPAGGAAGHAGVAKGGAEIRFRFDGDWTPEARAAAEYAGRLWGATIDSPVPIEVVALWSRFDDPRVLGMCGPWGWHLNFERAPLADTYYASAAANRLAGYDLDPYQPDIQLYLNIEYSAWYFGTDGRPPAGTVDFVTLVLHELGHGLSFSGSARVDAAGRGTVREDDGTPWVFSHFTRTGSGASLLAMPDQSTVLGDALRSDDVWFVAPDGTRAKLFAPRSGFYPSSYLHFDEYAYPAGHPDSLMTPTLEVNEVMHQPGPRAEAVLDATGWGGPAGPSPGPDPDDPVDPTTTTTTVAPGAPTVERLAGADRFETAARIAAAQGPAAHGTVLVATGRNWPDGVLAGAAAWGAPILLVEAGSVPEATASALSGLAPERVVVLGGPAVVDDAVLAELGWLTGAEVERIGGGDRYDTAATLMRRVFRGYVGGTIFVASGEDYPRALLAAAEAGFEGCAALLVPADGPVPASVAEALVELAPEDIWIIGDAAAVGPTTEASLATFAPVGRFPGETLDVLAAQVWGRVTNGAVDGFVLATEADFADGLVGAGFAAAGHRPLALVPRTCVPLAVGMLIGRLGVGQVTVLGGPAAVDPAVDSLTRC